MTQTGRETWTKLKHAPARRAQTRSVEHSPARQSRGQHLACRRHWPNFHHDDESVSVTKKARQSLKGGQLVGGAIPGARSAKAVKAGGEGARGVRRSATSAAMLQEAQAAVQQQAQQQDQAVEVPEAEEVSAAGITHTHTHTHTQTHEEPHTRNHTLGTTQVVEATTMWWRRSTSTMASRLSWWTSPIGASTLHARKTQSSIYIAYFSWGNCQRPLYLVHLEFGHLPFTNKIQLRIKSSYHHHLG
jgi:hypothetical protein